MARKAKGGYVVGIQKGKRLYTVSFKHPRRNLSKKTVFKLGLRELNHRQKMWGRKGARARWR